MKARSYYMEPDDFITVMQENSLDDLALCIRERLEDDVPDLAVHNVAVELHKVVLVVTSETFPEVGAGCDPEPWFPKRRKSEAGSRES